MYSNFLVDLRSITYWLGTDYFRHPFYRFAKSLHPFSRKNSIFFEFVSGWLGKS